MPYTGDQKREYQRRWIANRRAQFFRDKSCVKCGSTDRLELDHIDPSQKVTHNIWSWSKERQAIEIAKCQVLCYDHHLEKTKKDLYDVPPAHGTHSRYTTKKYRCRCDPCKAAHAKTNKDWRAKAKQS